MPGAGDERRAVGAGFLCVAMALLVSACGSDSTAPETITVSISPSQATVGAAGTAQFSATVSGTSNDAVTWSASAGTIAGSGSTATFTAPVSGGTITITVTSSADPTASATASVTVTPVAVSVTPSTVALLRGEEVSLTASVTGTEETGVSWTSSCGTLAGTGLDAVLTAPDEVVQGGCNVTVTSSLDPEKSASVDVEVLPDWLVTTTADPGTGTCIPSACSLRQALTLVMSDQSPVGADGKAVIRFAGSLNGQTVTLGSALPSINRAVRILGPAGGLVAIDANGSSAAPRRALQVTGTGDVEIHRLRITGGHAAGGGGIDLLAGASLSLTDSEVTDNTSEGGVGGGIRSNGNNELRLTRTVVSGNSATGFGGGILVGGTGGSTVHLESVEISGNASGIVGGGISLTNSTLEGHDVTVSGNRSGGAGGGLSFTGGALVTLANVVIAGNESDGSGGGASLGSGATLELVDAVISDNTASQHAGGLRADDAVVELVDVEFADNTAGATGGAISMVHHSEVTGTGLTIQGNAATLVGGGVSVDDSFVSIMESILTGNTSGSAGGGIHLSNAGELDLRESTVSENQATVAGGGAAVVTGGFLTLRQVDLMENEAGTGGGGGINAATGTTLDLDRIRVTGNATSGSGGGILTFGALDLKNSTLDGNQATVFSGGLRLSGQANALVENVTIVGNEAGTQAGGATLASVSVSLNGVTIAGNRIASGVGGGISVAGIANATMSFRNTIIAGNLIGASPGNCASVNSGMIVSGGHNLSDDTTCAIFMTEGSDLNDTPSGLAESLADNGGPTPTLALLEGSAAIDAGDADTCPSSDQRGFGRTGTCDIGAFEFNGVEP